jgi:VWFA-related protein
MFTQRLLGHALCGRAVALALIAGVMALAVSAGTPAIHAQQPGASVTLNEVDASQYPNLRAVVTVLTSAGIPATGLTADAFKVDGADGMGVSSVSAAQDAALPLGVVVVIDTSGSMAGAPLASARAAASQLIGQLGPNDQAAIIAFSDTARLLVPFTSDRAALAAGIDQLTAGGSTALFEAVEGAAYAARASKLPRQAVVLLTDGQNESQNTAATAASSLDVVRAMRVPMFTVGFGPDADTAYLGELATASGGRAFAADQLDVAQTYASIGTLLRSQYVVSLQASAAPDGQEATLSIAVNVDGQTVTSQPAQFVRGQAPPPVKPVAPQPAPASVGGGGDGARWLIVIISVLVVTGILLLVAVWLVRGALQRRAQRERDRHAGRVSGESIPAARETRVVEPVRSSGSIELLRFTTDGDSQACEVTDTPLTIGSAVEADIRLANDESVAPRHATVWLGEGRLRLRHVGGARPTLFEGRPIDVIILERGDEFVIGRARFRVGDLCDADRSRRAPDHAPA